MYKTLTFQKPKQLSSYPNSMAIIWLYPFTMVDLSLIGTSAEENQTSAHQVKVTANIQLVTAWGFYYAGGEDERSKNEDDKVMKILFEYGKKHVIEKLINEGALSKEEEFTIKNDEQYPFNASQLKDPINQTCEVPIGTQGTLKS